MSPTKNKDKEQEGQSVNPDDLRGPGQRVKMDMAAPESPIVYAKPEEAAKAEATQPDKSVTVKEGETAAQHEAHVDLSSKAIVDERIKREAETGLRTDEIARRQQEEARLLEEGRVEGKYDALSPQGTRDSAQARERPTEEEKAEQAEGASATSSETGTNATPEAEQYAQEKGVDLATVQGTGKDGRITKTDVEAAAGENQ